MLSLSINSDIDKTLKVSYIQFLYNYVILTTSSLDNTETDIYNKNISFEKNALSTNHLIIWLPIYIFY